MTIVHRRIFYGKVGMASPLVEHMRAADQIMVKHGAPAISRILTDEMTGRSDRVVAEWDVESISAMIVGMETVMANPEAQGEMSKWMEKLATLIEYAEGENWVVR